MMAAMQTQQEHLLGELLSVHADLHNIVVHNIVDVIDDIAGGSLFIARQGTRFNPLEKSEQIIAKKPVVVICAAENPVYNEMMQKRFTAAVLH